MAGFQIQFEPWNRFRAIKDLSGIRAFLRDVARKSEQAFIDGMQSPKAGRTYYSRRGNHQASAADQFPAVQTGALRGSVGTSVGAMEAVVGTNTSYSLYLRDSTSKMKSRRMSKEALEIGLQGARFTKPFARWSRT
jgi:phage gpG-like protein